MTLDTRLLLQFLAVAEAGSITAAAASLNLTQPAVTRALRDLERATGLTLAERLPRGIMLTAEGSVLADHARALRSELRSADATVAALRDAVSGAVAIGAGHTVLQDILPQVLARLTTERPMLAISVETAPTAQLLTRLSAGALDLVLAAAPVAVPEDLTMMRVRRSGIAVLVAAGHPLAGGPETSLAGLGDTAWALLPSGDAGRDRLLRRFAEAELPPPRIAVESWSPPFIYALVARTRLLTVGPVSGRAAIPSGLVPARVRDGGWERTIGLFTRRRGALRPTVRVLRDAIVAPLALPTRRSTSTKL